MKKAILNIAMVLLLIPLASCENKGGASSPEEAVRNAVKCLHENDMNGFVDCLAFSEIDEGSRLTALRYLGLALSFMDKSKPSDEFAEDITIIKVEKDRDLEYLHKAYDDDFEMANVEFERNASDGGIRKNTWIVFKQEGRWRVDGLRISFK